MERGPKSLKNVVFVLVPTDIAYQKIIEDKKYGNLQILEDDAQKGQVANMLDKLGFINKEDVRDYVILYDNISTTVFEIGEKRIQVINLSREN